MEPSFVPCADIMTLDSTNVKRSVPHVGQLPSCLLGPITDEIDWVLMEHYGFTDEELDFITNYDIRMGGARE